jgi:hypothetical protein
MTNPFPYSGFFTTPESIHDLLEYCESYTDSDRAIAFFIATITLNLAHEMFNEAMKEKTND